MSGLFVECPVCEETVDLTSSSRKSVVCPTCQRPIDLTKTSPMRRNPANQPFSEPTLRASPEALVSFKNTNQRDEQPAQPTTATNDSPPELKNSTTAAAC